MKIVEFLPDPVDDTLYDDGETWVDLYCTPLAVAGAAAARHRSATRGTARALRAVHCLGARTTLRVTTRSEAHVLYLLSQ